MENNIKNKFAHFFFRCSSICRNLLFASSFLWLCITLGVTIAKKQQSLPPPPATPSISQSQEAPHEAAQSQEATTLQAPHEAAQSQAPNEAQSIYESIEDTTLPTYDYTPFGGFNVYGFFYKTFRISDRYKFDLHKDYTFSFVNPLISSIDLDEARVGFANKYLKDHIRSEIIQETQLQEVMPNYLQKNIMEPLIQLPSIEKIMFNLYCYQFQLQKQYDNVMNEQTQMENIYNESLDHQLKRLDIQARLDSIVEHLSLNHENIKNEIQKMNQYLVFGKLEEEHFKSYFLQKMYHSILAAFDNQKIIRNYGQEIYEQSQNQIKRFKRIRNVIGITSASLIAVNLAVSFFVTN